MRQQTNLGMQPKQTFKKSERLCSKTLIETLFKQGKSFLEYPFKVLYLPTIVTATDDVSYPAKVLFTVPKRQFKKAVQRNKLKRLMREGYRKNKYQLYETLSHNNLEITLAYVYVAKETMPYTEIEKKIKASILRLKQEIFKTNKQKT